MLMRLRKSGAQTTAEYAILIALVIGAAMAMQVYVKRGLQGRVKDVVDHTGAGGVVGGANLQFGTSQYDPYYLESSGTTTQDTPVDNAQMLEGGGVTRDNTVETNIKGVRTQTINPSQDTP